MNNQLRMRLLLRFIAIVVGGIITVIGLGIVGRDEMEDEVYGKDATLVNMIEDGKQHKVSSTAYYNPKGNKTADGSETIHNLTVAGAREWLGCTVMIWDEDLNFMGYYEFHDTGYGKDGDIPRGETIDIYFDTYDECVDYGRRTVYIQIFDAEG